MNALWSKWHVKPLCCLTEVDSYVIGTYLGVGISIPSHRHDNGFWCWDGRKWCISVILRLFLVCGWASSRWWEGEVEKFKTMGEICSKGQQRCYEVSATSWSLGVHSDCLFQYAKLVSLSVQLALLFTIVLYHLGWWKEDQYIPVTSTIIPRCEAMSNPLDDHSWRTLLHIMIEMQMADRYFIWRYWPEDAFLTGSRYSVDNCLSEFSHILVLPRTWFRGTDLSVFPSLEELFNMIIVNNMRWLGNFD